ncbi:MAG: pyridoxal phosphate-dependent aminotransferase [Bradymonadaceae bacterium]
MWSYRRFPEQLEPTAFAERLDALRTETGSDVLDLTFSNPSRDFRDHRRDMSRHLEAAAGELSDVPYEPDPHGLSSARQAVTDYYRTRGASVPPSRLSLSASTSEAYTWLAKILADADDQIVIPAPSYPLFDHLLSLEAVETIPYRFDYDGAWHLDAGHLRRRLQEAHRPAAIFAVSPNGHVLSDADLARLEKLARAFEVPLVVDEVFLDFGLETADPPRSVLARDRAADDPPLTFVLGGLSKAAGLPGAKLGWIAVDGPDEAVDTAVSRLAFVADTFLSASTVTQLAAPDILGSLEPYQRQVRERLATNLEVLDDVLEREGALSRYPVEAGWYAIVRAPSFVDEASFALGLLDEHNVLVQPGFFYDLEPDGHLVVSLLTAPDAFADGVDRLVEALGRRV